MRGVEHIGFTVSDLDRSVAFYSVLFDDQPMARHGYENNWVGTLVGYDPLDMEAAFFMIPESEVILELVEYRRPAGERVDMETYNTGNAHLCLVVDDLAAEFGRLRRAGAEFRQSEPVVMPVGETDVGKAAYLRDPDGITIQLVEAPIVGRRRIE